MENATNKCPICGKMLIDDYLAKDVICPQCSADLKIFRRVDNADKTSQKRRKLLICLAVVILCVVICSAISIALLNSSYNEELTARNNELSQKNKEIATLTAKNDSLSGVVEDLKTKQSAHERVYIVRHGDGFYRISRNIYGDENHAREIAEMNGLTFEDVIHPGDKLKY